MEKLKIEKREKNGKKNGKKWKGGEKIGKIRKKNL